MMFSTDARTIEVTQKKISLFFLCHYIVCEEVEEKLETVVASLLLLLQRSENVEF
jgi:hypothetical protein